jgi:hypothetical protein
MVVNAATAYLRREDASDLERGLYVRLHPRWSLIGPAPGAADGALAQAELDLEIEAPPEQHTAS